MKKVISIFLTAVMMLSVLGIGNISAYAGDINTPASAELVYLNTPVNTLFRLGYPGGKGSDYVSETAKYFKFTAPSTDYFEFRATGYENTVYKTGSSANVYISIDDSYGKYVGGLSTNDVTGLTKKGIKLTQGQVYVVELSTSMTSIDSYATPDYGYAEQYITMSITPHVHDYYLESEYTYTNYYACHYCDSTYSVEKEAPKPAAPKIKKLKLTKKKATIAWTAVSGVYSYQIQYSTKKSFKGAKKMTVYSNRFSGNLPKIKKGKKYYVRVRSVSGGQYSSWSGTKSVKVK